MAEQHKRFVSMKNIKMEKRQWSRKNWKWAGCPSSIGRTLFHPFARAASHSYRLRHANYSPPFYPPSARAEEQGAEVGLPRKCALSWRPRTGGHQHCWHSDVTFLFYWYFLVFGIQKRAYVFLIKTMLPNIFVLNDIFSQKIAFEMVPCWGTRKSWAWMKEKHYWFLEPKSNAIHLGLLEPVMHLVALTSELQDPLVPQGPQELSGPSGLQSHQSKDIFHIEKKSTF